MRIRISRKQSIHLTVAILVLFFVLSIAMINTTSNIPTGAKLSDKAPEKDTTPEDIVKSLVSAVDKVSIAGEGGPAVHLKNFERSEIKKGKKVWEVKADSGNYQPLKNLITVTNPDLILYQKDGKEVNLTAGTASLALSGDALKDAEVEKNVVITVDKDKVKIETEKAVYSKEEDKVTTPGKVRITTESIIIEGNRLKANLEPQVFKLVRNVSTVIKPTKSKKKIVVPPVDND